MGNASGREVGGEGNGGDDGSNGDGDDSRMMRSPNRDSPAGDSMTINNSDKNRGFGNSFSNSHSIPPAPPTSARTTSPLSFGPQDPVAPLPMFNGPPFPNQMWQTESRGPVDTSHEQGIPTIITWNYGGNSVAVEGSWDNWTSRKQMQRSGIDHSILMVLQSGVYHYKFIVDGEGRYAADLPFLVDDKGQVCNILDVNDYVPENPESVAEFEAPASPEASYGQAFPSEEDFAKDPMVVPPQLHVTVLDVQSPDGEASSSSTSVGTKPQHVMLNHLFIERGWASQSLVALGMTHRYQSKYVTVVLYKPLKR